MSTGVKHQLIVLKKLDALCESFSLKSFPLFYCDLKFAGCKVCVHVCVCVCVCVCVLCVCVGVGMTSYND